MVFLFLSLVFFENNLIYSTSYPTVQLERGLV